jgi:hypothetical protein
MARGVESREEEREEGWERKICCLSQTKLGPLAGRRPDQMEIRPEALPFGLPQVNDLSSLDSRGSYTTLLRISLHNL